VSLRRGTPKPPKPLWDELTAAHEARDETRVQVAEEHIRAWAVTNGYEHPQGRPARADEAAR
jgi:hypothetical protein